MCRAPADTGSGSRMKMALWLSVSSLVLSSLTVALDGSYGIKRMPCYGRNSTTDWSDMGIEPYNLTMFFTPSRPGSQRIQVSEDGVVFDPHYVFYDRTFDVRDVTEKDDGKYSVLLDGVMTAVLILEVRDCAREVTVLYGAAYSFSLSTSYRHANTLEFTPQWYSDEPAVLLWNRTGNPQAVGGDRGRLVDNEWAIERITQEHGGYYTFKDKNQELAYRRKMIVEAQRLYFYKSNGEDFNFTVEMDPAVLDMSYTPSGGSEVLLMKSGGMESGWERAFAGRISRIAAPGLLQVRITDVQLSDAGLFQIRDQRGNLALVVELDVPAPEPSTIAPELTCFTGDGKNYRGEVLRTVSGKTCQRWSAQRPHKHDRTPENNLHKGLVDNYCRNPDNEKMPWCYTTDPQTRWDFCQVPRCDVSPGPDYNATTPCYNGDGRNYRGEVARTISGRTCQSWSAQTPHTHVRTCDNYPCKGLDNNYCRNPDNETMPWCYTTDSEKRWEYCPVSRCAVASGPASEPPTIVPELTCFTCEGVNYRGEVATTISGKTCQSWLAQRPHKHDRTPENHPHEGLDNNYCRNPDNERMPWCYTTDSRKRWEFCQVTRCDVAPRPELTCFTGDGGNYRGEVARTITGKTCQRWSAQRPHKHDRTPENNLHKGLDNNYCRNPDNEKMPWCYTTDSQTRWEYCQVPLCDAAPGPELTCYTGDGRHYRGEVVRTISGKTCQRWSSQRPQKHSRTPENHPHRGLVNNYCRNPDNEWRPWCYTTDSQTRWEYCPVPLCDVAPEPELTCYTGDGVNYRGEVARTISGKTCQRWSAQRPHEHSRKPEINLQKGLDNNYCRNPDSERRPWCYTTDSETRWEYCPVPRCDGAPEPGDRNCKSYTDGFGSHDQLSCKRGEFCCGSCINRYCCKDDFWRFDEDKQEDCDRY